jgi:DNA sulfur modification protein DndC
VKQASLFDGARLQMTDSIAMTIESLALYGATHRHWAIAWSGGKDSTAVLTLVLYLVESGRVPAPNSITVLQADTRMELLPLWLTARSIYDELGDHAVPLGKRGVALTTRVVMAPIEKRFLPYMLGRGVPPPNNGRLRWCTRQIKVDPMHAALEELHARRGKVLMLTGVRVGESARRDDRISLSCSRDGGECGHGWYQETLPDSLCDTLAPLLHWRICHVWEWLDGWAPRPEFGDWPTRLLAHAYGGRDGDEAAEIQARTGCVCCPLASRDSALDALVALPMWRYLAPLKELRALWEEMRSPLVRLRKPGGEKRKDGTLASNQHRMGPLTVAGRKAALDRVLDIQTRVNAEADRIGRPHVDMLNAEEIAFIEQCHRDVVYPDGWDGDEPLASVPFEDGGQLLLGEEIWGT